MMGESDTEETRAFWNRVPDDWETQVGDDGDRNRILNSDPVLWQFAGDARGLRVLDAGCGTGYLSRKLHERGANVVGVDFAEEMIDIARGKGTGIDYRVDSCAELKTLKDGMFDMVISNYVIMDTPQCSLGRPNSWTQHSRRVFKGYNWPRYTRSGPMISIRRSRNWTASNLVKRNFHGWLTSRSYTVPAFTGRPGKRRRRRLSKQNFSNASRCCSSPRTPTLLRSSITKNSFGRSTRSHDLNISQTNRFSVGFRNGKDVDADLLVDLFYELWRRARSTGHKLITGIAFHRLSIF